MLRDAPSASPKQVSDSAKCLEICLVIIAPFRKFVLQLSWDDFGRVAVDSARSIDVLARDLAEVVDAGSPGCTSPHKWNIHTQEFASPRGKTVLEAIVKRIAVSIGTDHHALVIDTEDECVGSAGIIDGCEDATRPGKAVIITGSVDVSAHDFPCGVDVIGVSENRAGIIDGGVDASGQHESVSGTAGIVVHTHDFARIAEAVH